MIQVETNAEQVLGQALKIVEGYKPTQERMRRTAEAVVVEVRMNFSVGGRPTAWKAKRDGSPSHLTKSGALAASVRVGDVTETTATVVAGQGLRYALIHQRGGVIQHPGSSKMQAFVIDGHLIVVHYTKPHKIPIPARPFMLVPNEAFPHLITAYQGGN